MGYEYEKVSEEYIARSLHEGLRDYLYVPCYNLSTVLGDSDGKINASTAQQITKGLSMAAPGIVLLGYTDSSGEVTDPLLGDEVYVNEVSPLAYEMHAKYIVNDESLVLANSSSDTAVSSPMIALSTHLVPLLVNAIGALYIDVMALYHELLKAVPDEDLTVSKQDLYRMDGNIRWITANLEELPYKPYELIEVLRELQRTLMSIRNVNQIFSATYSSKLSGMEFIGGV